MEPEDFNSREPLYTPSPPLQNQGNPTQTGASSSSSSLDEIPQAVVKEAMPKTDPADSPPIKKATTTNGLSEIVTRAARKVGNAVNFLTKRLAQSSTLTSVKSGGTSALTAESAINDLTNAMVKLTRLEHQLEVAKSDKMPDKAHISNLRTEIQHAKEEVRKAEVKLAGAAPGVYKSARNTAKDSAGVRLKLLEQLDKRAKDLLNLNSPVASIEVNTKNMKDKLVEMLASETSDEYRQEDETKALDAFLDASTRAVIHLSSHMKEESRENFLSDHGISSSSTEIDREKLLGKLKDMEWPLTTATVLASLGDNSGGISSDTTELIQSDDQPNDESNPNDLAKSYFQQSGAGPVTGPRDYQQNNLGDSPAVESFDVGSELDPQVQARYETLKNQLAVLCNELNKIRQTDPNLNPERDETTKLLDDLAYQHNLEKAEAAINTKIGEIKDNFKDVMTEEDANQIVMDLIQMGVFLTIDEIQSGKIQVSTFSFFPELYADYMKGFDEVRVVTATTVSAPAAPVAPVVAEPAAAVAGAAPPTAKEVVASIFKGTEKKDLVLAGERANVPYLGAEADETPVSWQRKLVIAGHDARAKVATIPQAKRAQAFAEQHEDETKVSQYGGDNAAELKTALEATLQTHPKREIPTEFQLLSGDTVANLKKLQEDVGSDPARKVGGTICANDTRFLGMYELGGSQEEQVAWKSNLSALAQQFHDIREGKEHHVPLLGAMYAQDAVFMDPDKRGESFKADVSFVAALDLSHGYIRKEIASAADAAGIPFDEFVKYITKMKFAALLGSMLENGVTDVLMSIPGTGSFRNPIGMVKEVLDELLFQPNAPFKNRFVTVNFNVYGDAATARGNDRLVAKMLTQELGVPADDYTYGPVEQQVSAIAAKHKELVGEIASRPGNLVAFYYAPLLDVDDPAASNPTGFLGNFAPCKCEVFGQKFRCVEAAFQWKKYSEASQPRVGEKDRYAKQREKLAKDPRLEKLISATGDEAFHINRALKKDYPNLLDKSWDNGLRDQAMWEALSAKFTQNPEYREMLRSTYKSRLLEHNERVGRDTYWSDNGDGTGVNMLGKMLMALRRQLDQPSFGVLPKISNATVNEDDQTSGLIGTFNAQQETERTAYTIFAREQKGAGAAGATANTETAEAATVNIADYTPKTTSVVEFYEMEFKKLKDNIENKPPERLLENLKVLSEAVEKRAEIEEGENELGLKGIKGQCLELISEIKATLSIPLPLRIAETSRANYEWNGRGPENNSPAARNNGILDIVTKNDSQGWSVVGDGSMHGNPTTREKLLKGWDAFKETMSAKYPDVVKNANTKEELIDGIHDLIYEAAEKFNLVGEDQGSTFSFTSVVEFRGEKLAVISYTGDSPIFHYNKESGKVTRYTSGCETDFMPWRDETDHRPKPQLISVKPGDVILGLTDGFEKFDQQGLESWSQSYQEIAEKKRQNQDLVAQIGKLNNQIDAEYNPKIAAAESEDAKKELRQEKAKFSEMALKPLKDEATRLQNEFLALEKEFQRKYAEEYLPKKIAGLCEEKSAAEVLTQLSDDVLPNGANFEELGIRKHEDDLGGFAFTVA